MHEPYGNYYATPPLAAHYDADYACRPDIPFYLALAQELQAQVVADIGAGTGLLCSRLVEQGHQAIGVEPQATMLSLAKSQPYASDITWIQGTAADLEDECANLILMTGHVAQYFLDQSAWVDVLIQARRALLPGGHVAFEIRNAAVEEWRGWADEAPRDIGWGTVRGEILQDGDLITHVDRWSVGDRNWATSETLRFPTWG
jgi:SAM-dependent methyltransferase